MLNRLKKITHSAATTLHSVATHPTTVKVVVGTTVILTEMLQVAANHTSNHTGSHNMSSTASDSSSSSAAAFANDSSTLLDHQTTSPDASEEYLDHRFSTPYLLSLITTALATSWVFARLILPKETLSYCKKNPHPLQNRTHTTVVESAADDNTPFGSTGETFGRETKKRRG